MRLIDLVVFDLDGTLVDTLAEIADAVNDTLRHFDLKPVPDQQVSLWIGHGTDVLLRRALVDGGVDLQHGPRFVEASVLFDDFYAARCGTRSRAYPGVHETLAALRTADTRLAIVTNKNSRHTQRVLFAHELHERFDRVISGDSLPSLKPDPAGVRACLNEFGIDPARALFVGDSSIDAATARAAGVPVWLLPHGYNMGRPVSEVGADRIIENFDALRRALVLPAANAG